MSRQATENIDYTSRDYRAFKEMMIQKLREKMPEYTDTSETDAGIVIIEALANGLDILSLYMDYIANDLFLPTTQSRKTAVMLANTLGYYPYNKTASEYEQVFVLSATRNTTTLIPKGTVVSVPDTELYYETQEDLIIPANKLGNEKSGDEYLYHVTVKSGSTISDDIIGSSTGVAGQTFTLSYTGVIIDTLKVFVDDVEWNRVSSFMGQKSTSQCYVATINSEDECVITFGDNISGMIPQAGYSNISAEYMIGGGTESNVSNNTITEMESNVSFVNSTFNIGINVSAVDAESIDSIRVNAPVTYFTRNRIVTLDDFKPVLLKAFPNDIQDVSAVFSVNPTASASNIVQAIYIGVCVKFIQNRTGTATLTDIENYLSSIMIAGTHLGYYNGSYDNNIAEVEFPHQYDSTKNTYELVSGICEATTITLSGTTTVNVYLKGGYTSSTTLTNQIKAKINEFLYNLDFKDDLIITDLEKYVKDNFSQFRSIKITCPSGNIIQRTSTDVDGYYSFANVSVSYG